MRAMLITSRRREKHMSRLYAACLCVLLPSLGWGQERTKETFRDVAGRMVKAINAADYEGIRKDFNKEMLEAFPVEKCRTFFSKEISGKFGKITNLEPPPSHWTPEKKRAYLNEAKEIHAALSSASAWLSKRLAEKIAAYAGYC